MNEEMMQRLVNARAELEATRAAVARAEQDLKGMSTTVISRDRAVEVTVGAQGELAALQFLDGKYRTMGAANLAASIVEAAQEGRAQMARRVVDAFRPLTTTLPSPPSGESTATGYDIEWDKIFGPLLDAAESGPGQQSASDKLRDEIDEDPGHG
ncbi:YbaB/EbfC family nucleoid-associated protein [Streptomyces sp. NPDC006654]|uniref:YbaB/EbfC family nucleoid-associated protein n=1 Tax=Streptomyces sp. NPDC006654 TaxID=3156897 RepID=UPI0033EAAED9